MNHNSRLDGVALFTSVACLVHCLALPLLFALLPVASTYLALPESFHVGAFIVAVPASSIAIFSGYRHHGAALPVALALVGLTLLGTGALGGQSLPVETGLSVIGSVLLAVAHIQNWRLRHSINRLPVPS